MTMSDTRKEPENTGKPARSGPGIDRKAPLRGVPVLSGRSGRPRLDGERHPGGRLKVASAKPPSSGLTALTFVQGEALRRYSKDTERSETSRDADRRLEARQSLAAASGALTPRHKAIVDLVLIKGRSVRDLSAASGQPVDALNRLLTEAADTLAVHYETRRAA